MRREYNKSVFMFLFFKNTANPAYSEKAIQFLQIIALDKVFPRNEKKTIDFPLCEINMTNYLTINQMSSDSSS